MHSSKYFFRSYLFLGAMLLSAPASATLVTTSFSGVVMNHNAIVQLPAIGSPLLGSFTIDIADTSGVGDNCVGTPNCWADSSASWTWNALSIDATNATPFTFGVRIEIFDSAPGTGDDQFVVRLGGLSLTSVALTLTDTSGTAFESTSNPLLPSFGDFGSSSFSYRPLCLTSISCIVNPFYTGELTSLEAVLPTDVPAPASLLLFSTGLLGLLGKRATPFRTFSKTNTRGQSRV